MAELAELVLLWYFRGSGEDSVKVNERGIAGFAGRGKRLNQT